jgi:hypothetical protein
MLTTRKPHVATLLLQLFDKQREKAKAKAKTKYRDT